MKKFLKVVLQKSLASFGYEIRKIDAVPNSYNKIAASGRGFPYRLKEAQKAGVDVNEWQEQKLGWLAALPILQQTTFPYLKENSIVCELGPGTGRSARHFLKNPRVKELYLVDDSIWIVNFLQEYFSENQKVRIHLNTGYSLPFFEDSQIDLIFSSGCFISFKLGLFYCYSLEFFRVLKPGGYCIFDYIDIELPEGWEHLKTYGSDSGGNCYTYHTGKVIDKIFLSSGFEIVQRYQIGKTVYVVFRKPDSVCLEPQRINYE